MMHGRGKQVKASGDIYEGDFQFGLRFVKIYIYIYICLGR